MFGFHMKRKHSNTHRHIHTQRKRDHRQDTDLYTHIHRPIYTETNIHTQWGGSSEDVVSRMLSSFMESQRTDRPKGRPTVTPSNLQREELHLL